MDVPRFRPRPPDAIPDPVDPLALLTAWWEAVGPPMALVASPRGFARRRLQVAVPDTGWKREMEVHIEEILARLRRMEGLGRLEGIDLTIEAESSGTCPSIPGDEAEEILEEPPGEIALSARSIPDTGMARRWTAAVARILARRARRPGP